MPLAGNDARARAHAHYRWAQRYAGEGRIAQAIPHFGRALYYGAPSDGVVTKTNKGKFVAKVSKDPSGDKIYVCPHCKMPSSSFVAKNPEEVDKFPHTDTCPNKGKIPVESIEDLGKFLVEVSKDKDGDRIYICPECDNRSGTQAVKCPEANDAFIHRYDCTNKTKIPVPVETGKFVVRVSKDAKGNKIYVCPACGLSSSPRAVSHPEDVGAFPHEANCRNKQKIPVEQLSAP